jgi:hypothetical protein
MTLTRLRGRGCSFFTLPLLSLLVPLLSVLLQHESLEQLEGVEDIVAEEMEAQELQLRVVQSVLLWIPKDIVRVQHSHASLQPLSDAVGKALGEESRGGEE